MSFVADDLGAWLIGVLADAGRRKLVAFVLGDEQERALHQAGRAALTATATELCHGDPEAADQIAMVVGEVFQTPARQSTSAHGTLLEELHAGIAAQLAVLDDRGITAEPGLSSADALGIPAALMAEKLAGQLLREITGRGARGGPLEPLANQFGHDRSFLLALRLEGKIDHMDGLLVSMLAVLDQARAIPGRAHRTAGARIDHALVGHKESVNAVAFSPDGALLATTSSDKTTRLWDTSTGQTVRALIGHTEMVGRIVKFSPDGALIATQSHDRTARLWSTATGQLVHTLLGHTENVVGVTFSPDGNILATASQDNTARLWSTATGEAMHTLAGHTKDLVQVAFFPDGTKLATVSRDGTARLWDVATGKTIRILRQYDDIFNMALSPDGALMVTIGLRTSAQLWDTATGRTIHKLVGNFARATFGPDGTLIATAGRDGVRLLNTATGETVHTLTGHANVVTALAFSPDGTQLATASADKTARLWNTVTGQTIRTLVGHRDQLTGVTFNSSGDLVATGCHDKTARLWVV
jgi:WD40 repeat protein